MDPKLGVEVVIELRDTESKEETSILNLLPSQVEYPYNTPNILNYKFFTKFATCDILDTYVNNLFYFKG